MNRLLQLREKRHLSQQELGKILGVSQQQLSKYESGQSLMHSDFIIQCAEFFSVTTVPLSSSEPERIYRSFRRISVR